MKRSPMKRGRARSWNSTLRARSPKTEARYAGPDGRRAFVASFLAASPACQARLAACTGRARDIHEVISRARGGSILPGEIARKQGQIFMSVCRSCHAWLSANPREAEARGLLRKGTRVEPEPVLPERGTD